MYLKTKPEGRKIIHNILPSTNKRITQQGFCHVGYSFSECFLDQTLNKTPCYEKEIKPKISRISDGYLRE